jgi:hypothetical protein
MLTNKSRTLVTVELKSGEWIHLAPGETSRPIDDVEVRRNDRVEKLIGRHVIALSSAGADAGPKKPERKPDRAPKG